MSSELLYGVIELYRFDEHNNTYSSCCVIVYKGKKRVEVKGLDNRITTKNWKELYAYMQKKGVRVVKYERRRRNGAILHKVINVKPI